MTDRIVDRKTLDARIKAWQLFLETHGTLLYQLERELQSECNLPLTWYDVMLQLNEAPDRRLRMQELVGSLMLTKSGITRLIDRMEGAGLIARQGCPSDRRGSFASLTDSGREALERAAPVHRRGIEEHFGRHLNDPDLAAFTTALAKLRAGTPSRREGRACLPRSDGE